VTKLRAGIGFRDLDTLFRIGVPAVLSDRQLLEQFGTKRGETSERAFAALVERHGPMVLRVCRAILRDVNDVDDAFQAAFVVLARKGRGTLWVRDSIGPWLHAVACRVAVRVRADSARRRHHERSAAARANRTITDTLCDDAGCMLHEEVDRLPDHFRLPLVLCYLEGLSHQQAANQLGWPVGTVRSRLARGRDRLRDRLERRGAAPMAGFSVGGFGSELTDVPRTLADATVRGVASAATESVAALARSTLRVLFWQRAAKVAAATVLLTVAGLGAAGLTLGEAATAGRTLRTGGRGSRVSPNVGTAVSQSALKTEAELIAQRALQIGSDLFDAKDAHGLAATYAEDGELNLVTTDVGGLKEELKRGRGAIESFYRDLFKDAGTIDSENTIEFAQLVSPDVLVIHGRFRPDRDERELSFIQVRMRQGHDWLLAKLSLFLLAPKR
jgi:RNA polymerase sigma factor (sigma-70 family)